MSAESGSHPSPVGSPAGSQARIESLRRGVFSLPALVSLLVAGGFLLFLVTRFDVNLDVAWERVHGTDPWLLVAAFAVHHTSFVFRSPAGDLLAPAGGRQFS